MRTRDEKELENIYGKLSSAISEAVDLPDSPAFHGDFEGYSYKDYTKLPSFRKSEDDGEVDYEEEERAQDEKDEREFREVLDKLVHEIEGIYFKDMSIDNEGASEFVERLISEVEKFNEKPPQRSREEMLKSIKISQAQNQERIKARRKLNKG